MTKIKELGTKHLKLRRWQNSDLPLFAKMNADPDVMAFYPNTLNEEESNAMANRIIALLNERG